MKNIKLAALAFALATAPAARASSWLAYCWNGGKIKHASESITLRRADNFGSNWSTSFGNAISRWNDAPSDFVYSHQGGDTSVGLNNLQSEAFWSSDPGDGAPAVTYLWWDAALCTSIMEADVVFNNTVAWTTSMTKGSLLGYGGNLRPFETTALHELGHAQGLDHTASVYSIMGQDWTHVCTNGSTARAEVGVDAYDLSRSVYGWDGLEDIQVSHWRRTGSSGGYSSHARTRIFDTASTELAKFATSPEPIYKVSKGQSVRVEFTYEYLGFVMTYPAYVPKSVQLAFYVSTNSTISADDTKIATKTISLGEAPVTTWFTVTIPSNLALNTTYYLGVIGDDNNAIGELSAANNKTYTAIRVQ